MKKTICALLGALMLVGMTSCGNDVSNDNYPKIETIQSFIPGNWEVTTWLKKDGSSYDDTGFVYKITKSQSGGEFAGGILVIIENGHAGSNMEYRLEPIFRMDLEGGESEEEVAVEIFFNTSHYVIASISETTMKWLKITSSNGKVVISQEGMIFTKKAK